MQSARERAIISNTSPKWEGLPKTQTKMTPGNDTRCRMLAALSPETPGFHRIRWRQIVQASDGIEGDIGETGGEVKFGVLWGELPNWSFRKGFSCISYEQQRGDSPLNKWLQFFEKMVWLAIVMMGIAGYEAYSNWNHAQTWKNTEATVEAVRSVCRFHKREIWQRHGRSADEYCDDKTAIAERKRAGWNQNRWSLVEIQVVYSDEKNQKSYAKLLPWESDIGLLTVVKK